MRSRILLSAAAPLGIAAVLVTGCGSSSPLLLTTVSSTSTPSSSSSRSSSSSPAPTSSSSSSSSSLSAAHDPCALLTAADVAGVLGGTPTRASATSSVCSYADLASGTAVAISTADIPGVGGTAAATAAVRAAAGTAGGTVTSIDGIGDVAAGATSGDKNLVAFVKGNTLVVVVIQGATVTDPPAKTQALAEIVAGKL